MDISSVQGFNLVCFESYDLVGDETLEYFQKLNLYNKF